MTSNILTQPGSLHTLKNSQNLIFECHKAIVGWLSYMSVEPESTTEAVDRGSIPSRVKSTIIKIGFHCLAFNH